MPVRVLWMLEELGEPYEFVAVKLRSPEAYALNPSGKVPILVDDLKVTDSAAICVYLADKHADKGFGANPRLAGRAEMDSWMHFAQSEISRGAACGTSCATGSCCPRMCASTSARPRRMISRAR